MAAAPDPELLAIYRTEAVETIETVHEHLLRIEQGAPDRDARLEDVLRLAHDIKGSARVVGYELVGRLAHALEACLLLGRGRAEVPRAWADLAFRASDQIRALSLEPERPELIERAEALLVELRAAAAPAATTPVAPLPAVAVPPADAPAPAQAAGDGPVASATATLRVSRSSVDAVSDDAAVTLMDSLGVAERLRAVGRALDALSALRLPREGAAPSEVRRVRAELLDGLRRAREAHRALADALRQLDGHTRELDERARALCLAPAAPLFTHLERVARDAAAALGRQVQLQLEGRGLLIDVLLTEALKGPLTHAVRNALDHGIEPPPERIAAGKPASGTLRLSLREEGDRLIVEVADDGRGVDLAAARRKLGPRAAGLDDERVLAALLRAGVSTRDTVSTLSGRGLGLGAMVVLTDRLHGDSRLLSPPGEGTTLRAALPRQISLIEALVVRSGGLDFALPASGLIAVDGAGAGAPALAAVLGLPAPPPSPDARGLRLRVGEAEACVAVDADVRTLRVVQRPLPAHIGELACVQGATILPEGAPALLLDPRAVGAAVRAAEPAAEGARILLADDSATLRATLAAGLAARGFEIVSVADGAAAIERLACESFDAVVSDIQMPKRDGFEVAAACAGRLPCVLITAQPGPAGAARARALGVTYLPKDAQLVARVESALRSLLPAPVESRP